MSRNGAPSHVPGVGFERRFRSLFHAGRALAFPCNAAGAVDVDALSLRDRDNFLSARRAVGRDPMVPAVTPRVVN